MRRADYVKHSHWHCPTVHTVHIKNRQINDNIFSMLRNNKSKTTHNLN